MAGTKIHFLGGFLIERDQRPIAPIPSAQSRSLFAYLVTNRDRSHARDFLAGMFWPENTEASARRRLSQALWRISTALGAESGHDALIETATDVVSFNSRVDYWLDVEAFDRHVANAQKARVESEAAVAGELEAAVNLYQGEFLPGFYDDWTTIERHRLQRMYLGSLDRLIAIHKSAARYEWAVAYAQRLALQDPLREEAHREVMRLNLLLGRTAEALHQYEVCQSILAEELGTQPEYETRELRNMIASYRDKGELPFAPSEPTPLMDSTRRIPMVGRESERRAALRRIEDTLNRRGGVILIEGEEGVGKSRLLEELVADSQWRGLTPLVLACRQTETRRPFHAIGRIIEEGLTPLRARQLEAQLHSTVLADVARVAPRLHGLLPNLSSSTPRSDEGPRRRLHDSIRQCLFALSGLNPVIVVIDDLQWIDHESAELIGQLGGDLSRRSLTMCIGYRSFEARERPSVWQTLVDLDTQAHAERITLQPLRGEQITLLVQESLRMPVVSADLAEGLALETGGNPLFILETLRAWNDEGRDWEKDSGEPPPSGSPSFPVTGGVSQVIARRIERLGRDARALINTAAVLSARASIDALSVISGLTRVSAIDALEEATKRGFLGEKDDGYGFTHDQIRKVVADSLEDGHRRRLHQRSAQYLERNAPDRLEDLARHFARAGVAEKAQAYSAAAARQAISLGAFETAVAHFERAAEWRVPHGRWELLLDWETALDVLGRRNEQATLLDELEGVADEDERVAEVRRRRAEFRASQGEYGEAIRLASEAMESRESVAPGPERARLLRTLGLITSRAGDAHEGVAYLDAAAEAVSGDPAAEASVLSDLGNVLAEAQEYSRGIAALDRALERYREADDLFGVAEAGGRLATIHMEMGDVDASIDLYENALRAARTVGYRRGVAVNLANLGNALYVGGSIGSALRRYREAADLFAAIGDQRGAALLRANRASVRFSVLGDDTIGDEVEASLAYFRSTGPDWGEAFCREHLAALAHRRGEVALARRHIDRGLEQLSEGGHLWVEVHLRRQAALIELSDEGIESATNHLERALEICRELDLKDVLPTVQSVAAMILVAVGAPDDASETARMAIDNLRPGVEQPYLIWHRYHIAAKAAGQEHNARTAALEAGWLLDRVIDSLDESDRESARRAVPEHRAIIETRREYKEYRERVLLPSVDAPFGRPLREGDWTTTEWTISDPSDFELPDGPKRRRARILRIVSEAQASEAAPRVEDLADALEVSNATIRRDLAALRSAGHEVETRGSR